VKGRRRRKSKQLLNDHKEIEDPGNWKEKR